ncbi:unannotated protein [freshwater metagenome]|uniref:Unannotated protein n=1 Tax=freshwater metagenome TaxID=449393 RepID=A0A6J7D3C6_9ZZZZ
MGTHEISTTDFSIEEMSAAWEQFQRLGARGRDWAGWSALFTDDATYIEHCLGRFHGAAGIHEWILGAMEPVAPMTFSVDWAILQPPYLAFNIWNHMPDPAGGGARYSFSNLSLLIYAGNGKWSWEEDFYAPDSAGKTVMAWYVAGGKPTMAADPSITHVTMAAEPTDDDRAGVAEMVRAWRAGTPTYTADATVWDQATGQVPSAEAAAFTTPADVVVMDGKRAFLRCADTGVALTHGGSGRIAFEERAHNPAETTHETA